MATGAWAPNSSTNKKIRLISTLSYSGNPASGDVTVRKIIKAECDYRLYDSTNSFNTSGAGGYYNGSKNINFPSSNSKITLFDDTSTVSLDYGSKKTVTAKASLSGIDYIGSSATASVSDSITLPARPYAVPSAVTALTASRVSDARCDLGWTRNSSTAGFYEGIRVLRSTDGGAYVQLASLAGTATGYADTTTSANHNYRYKVQPFNSTGSADTLSSTIYNTPAAPTNVTAVKTAATTVTVSWNNTANTETATEVQRSTDNGATWSTIATTGADATSYVDSSVPGGTVIYRARNTRSTLVSAYSAVSNSVATLTAPAAPTLNVVPAAVVPSSDDAETIGWIHNSQDGSQQTSAEVEVTKAGATTTATVTGTGNTFDIDTSALTDGQTVSVRVRTKGLYASFSPWSALYTFTVKDAPQLVISSPASDSAVADSIPVVIDWDYIDSVPCAEWILKLYQGDTLVHTANGTSETLYELDEDTYIPLNNTSYRIALYARSGSSLTATVERLFSVEYAPPATPSLEATVDIENGAVQLAAFFGDDEAAPAANYLSIARIDGDEVVILASGISDGTVVIDPVPLLNRVNTYRVMAHGDYGLNATLLQAVDVQVGPWFIWNFGDALSKTAKLKGNPQWSHTYTTEQELFQMAGRKYPVLMSGKTLGEAIDFSGTARTDEQREQLDELALWPKRAIYREPHGIKKTVKVQVSSSEAGGPRKTEYQVKMEVVD